MYYISTYPLGGKKLIQFAEELRHCELYDVGFELFYDNIPFNEAKYYRKFLHGIKLGMHCPMEDCCLLAPKGSLEIEYTLDKHKACFELAQSLGAEYVVIHTNSLAHRSAEDIAVEKAILSERMAMTADTAKEFGLRIAVENVGFGYNSSLVADMSDFISLADNRSLEFLVDTGHAHTNGWDIPALIDTLGDRIAGFHFHDNDGTTDSHLPIGNGTTDWDSVFAAIKRSAVSADRTVEYALPYAQNTLTGVQLLKNKLDDNSEEKYE
ncbi:MAG: sugar phosphate isomerase/epimerase family protein [Oscillospiraceae bacterium]